MDLQTIENRIRSHIEGCDVRAETDGYYVTVHVISDQFEDMRAVKRQQTVYAALADLIADGSLHAINIDAKAPSEVGQE